MSLRTIPKKSLFEHRPNPQRNSRIQLYAWIMFIVFPVGLPIAGYLILWQHSQAIENRDSRRGGADLDICAVVMVLISLLVRFIKATRHALLLKTHLTSSPPAVPLPAFRALSLALRGDRHDSTPDS